MSTGYNRCYKVLYAGQFPHYTVVLGQGVFENNKEVIRPYEDIIIVKDIKLERLLIPTVTMEGNIDLCPSIYTEAYPLLTKKDLPPLKMPVNEWVHSDNGFHAFEAWNVKQIATYISYFHSVVKTLNIHDPFVTTLTTTVNLTQ